MGETVKIVPALCTQCGGSVEVDSASEKATCPFCGASFIVEKAINNYNVQHATIEHADSVNIDMRGAVKDVLDFMGDQMKESRVQRQQMKKIEVEKDKLITVTFFKVFGLVMVAMMVFGIIAFIILNLTDRSDGDTVADPAEQTMTSSEESHVTIQNSEIIEAVSDNYYDELPVGGF